MSLPVLPWCNNVLKCIKRNANVGTRSYHQLLVYCLTSRNENILHSFVEKYQKFILFHGESLAMPKLKRSKQKAGSKTKLKDVNMLPSGNITSTSKTLRSTPNTTFSNISNENVKKKSGRRKKKKNVDPVTQLTNSFSNLDVNSKSRTSASKPVKHFSRSAGSSRTTAHKIASLEDVARYIRTSKAKNIIVMCGAGISTASGIPDFRTPGTGLYYNLQKYNIPTPTAVFDLEYFHMKPKPFFELAKELYPSGKYRPNLAHYFLRSLHEKGLLLRVYTQNIDGLERLAGIPPTKLVEAHGTFTTASCTKCGKKYNGEMIKDKIFANKIPRCELTPLCYGIVKPDIVFFGEDLPKRFYYYLKDFPNCDLLIVMGTSLEVEPFASLVDSVRCGVPRLLINRERVGPFKSKSKCTDAFAPGNIVDVVERFTTLLGWKRFVNDTMNEHEKLYEVESSSDVQTDSGISSASSESDLKEPRKIEPLPPPNGNIKRYFHTIRSTPLPKAKTFVAESTVEPSPVPPSLSYFDYLRDTARAKQCSGRLLVNRPCLTKCTFENAPKIEYAQTIVKKNSKTKLNNRKFSCASMPSRLFDSSSSDDQSDSTSSESES